jgi:hypothetical protein
MAGRGPAPKDPEKRRRRNADPVPQTVVTDDGQLRGPELPDFEIERDGQLVDFVWPARTVQWWQTWRISPQAQAFTDTDWSFLLDTALLHARLWSGEASVAAELRLRVAKFGATPEDRARLRLSIGEPEQATAKRPASKSRYEHLRPA